MPHFRTSPRPSLAVGFTLIELMVALAILSVLVLFAVPSFREISLNNRSTNAVNGLLADLSLARSEAVKFAQVTTVAAVGGDWSNGWDVFVDANDNGVMDGEDRLLKESGPINTGVGIDSSFTMRAVAGAADGSTEISRFSFGRLGQSRTPEEGARFAFCRPDLDAGKSTGIRIDPSGRAQSVRNLAGVAMSCD